MSWQSWFRPRQQLEIETRLRELRTTTQSINTDLRRALGLPGIRPGRHYYHEGETDMARSLTEALESVRATKGLVGSIIADRAEIKKRLDEVLADVDMTAEKQAQIEEIFQTSTKEAEDINAALHANPAPGEGTPTT